MSKCLVILGRKKWLWAGRDCGADLDCRWAATCQADLHPLRPWIRDADTHKTVLKCAAQAGCPLTWCLCVHVCDCSCLMLKVCQWQDEHIYLVQLSALCVHATKEKRAFKEEKARQPGTQPAVRHTRTHTHMVVQMAVCQGSTATLCGDAVKNACFFPC